MFEDRSPKSPFAAIATWAIAVMLSAVVVFFLNVETFVETMTQPTGIVILLIGVVVGAAQDAGVLTNERLREAASDRRVAFVIIVVAILIGAVAGRIFSDDIVIYIGILTIGAVYASAVVRTGFVVRGSELS